MSLKKYCFVAEKSKNVNVYSISTITSFNDLLNVNPNVSFKHLIDEYSKISLFYIGSKNIPNSIEDRNYFLEKTTTIIKSIFKVSELLNFKLITEGDSPRIEFSIIFDSEGNFVPRNDIKKVNEKRPILTHSYTYNFYKLYNN